MEILMTKFIYCIETEGSASALMKIPTRMIRNRSQDPYLRICYAVRQVTARWNLTRS
jgi:hypothetical protein